MVTRSFKLASISFLTFSLLLGAHQYRLHAHDHSTQVSQTENLHSLKNGSATMFQTNPYGMPGADTRLLPATNLNGYAAAYGLTPPTALNVATLQAQSVAATPKDKTKPWYSYIGLLGLLGLLGLGSRSNSTHSE
ncbi:hypothetical protein [Paenibacillus oryzisoli]|uniref:Uncharacterized protein n=1 Tax=Paenibacillus oryzisoli TaxID=1850517 RepID=A0A198ARA6_9BACL|nr:hypothetical protein [Paenibacillus oryzisoli]OAS23625.1 hypothetical protein A8708_31790 [Paenibacillus oryzisoli]